MTTPHAVTIRLNSTYYLLVDTVSFRLIVFRFMYFSRSLCHWCCWMCTANSKWCEFQRKSPSAKCIVLTAFRFYSIKRSQYSKHCIVILTPSCARHTNDVVFHFKNSTATTTKKIIVFCSIIRTAIVCTEPQTLTPPHHIDVLPWHTHPRDGIEMDVRVLRSSALRTRMHIHLFYCFGCLDGFVWIIA